MGDNQDLAKLKDPFSSFDIEWRIQKSGFTNGRPWAMVLAYVTARAIQERLDDVCGPENWKPEYKEGPSGGVLCGLSIRIDGEWVTKWDGAENTNVEAVKGGISGALKRAGAVWGIGRYLYRLKSYWAVFDDNGEYRSEIKDGNKKEWHSWNPPKLPKWALPTEEVEEAPEEAEDIQHDEAIQVADEKTIQRINIMVKQLGIDRDEKIRRVNRVIKRKEPITSTSQLTPVEADMVINALNLALDKAKSEKSPEDGPQELTEDTMKKIREICSKCGIASDLEILGACAEFLNKPVELWADMNNAEGLTVLSRFIAMDKAI